MVKIAIETMPTNRKSVSTRSACFDPTTGTQSMKTATSTIAPPMMRVRISSGTVWRDLSTRGNYQVPSGTRGVP